MKAIVDGRLHVRTPVGALEWLAMPAHVRAATDSEVPMLEALGAGVITAVVAADLLAGLHARLHALPPQSPHKPGDRPVHLDLHPANVMLETRGPVVIDWRNSGQGLPEVDVAMSALIVAQVAVDSAREEAALAACFLAAFMARVGTVPPKRWIKRCGSAGPTRT